MREASAYQLRCDIGGEIIPEDKAVGWTQIQLQTAILDCCPNCLEKTLAEIAIDSREGEQ